MDKPKRFDNAMRNSLVASAGQILNILCGFVLRIVFIRTLGKEYLGVNGVMESMLTLLSVAELGIGTSVAFALYKPVNDNNKQKIGVLMAFYSRTYKIIGCVTLVFGILMMPFMGFFTDSVKDSVSNLKLIYILFLSGTVISYFFSYKRTLINAYQNHYINSLNENIFSFVKHALQCIVLFLWHDYILFLIINIVCVFGSNLVISVICDKMYGFIKDYKHEKLPGEDAALMKKSIVSLMYQRIGASLVTGTDNLMITYAGVALMGVYSNYTLVVQTITRIIYSMLQSIMGSIGNLMVQQDNEHKYNVYEEIVFANFCIHFIVSVGFAGTLERFITIFAGETWLLSPTVTVVVILNFFLWGMRQPNVLVIESAGLFNRMRAKAVMEVIVNLIVSLVFLIVLKMGIYGVLLGTTTSMVTVCIWWEALAVHRYSFKRPLLTYYKKYFTYLLVAFTACYIARFLSGKIPLDGVPGFIAVGFASVAVAGLFIIIFFGNSREFKKLLSRVIKKEESQCRKIN